MRKCVSIMINLWIRKSKRNKISRRNILLATTSKTKVTLAAIFNSACINFIIILIHCFFFTLINIWNLKEEQNCIKELLALLLLSFPEEQTYLPNSKVFSNNSRSSMAHLYSLSLSRNKIKLTYFLCIMHDFGKWGKRFEG